MIINLGKIEDVFDDARFVRVKNEFVFIWFGGNTINVYDDLLENFHCWTMGSPDKPTMYDALDSINDTLENDMDTIYEMHRFHMENK